MGKRSVAAVGILLAATTIAAAAAPAKSPTQCYLDYRTAVAKAKSLEEVLPLLSPDYRAMLGSRPRKDRPVWLGRLKEEAALRAVEVRSESVEGDRATLEATATNSEGHAVHGRVQLVLEEGVWKLDEEFWST